MGSSCDGYLKLVIQHIVSDISSISEVVGIKIKTCVIDDMWGV